MLHRILGGTALLVTTAIPGSAASAQTYTWTGESSLNWSDPGNWADGVAPTSSTTSTILFPQATASGLVYQSTNDLPSLDVGTIQLLGGQVDGHTVHVHQRVDSGSN